MIHVLISIRYTDKPVLSVIRVPDEYVREDINPAVRLSVVDLKSNTDASINVPLLTLRAMLDQLREAGVVI